jgi:hypothetical protein
VRLEFQAKLEGVNLHRRAYSYILCPCRMSVGHGGARVPFLAGLSSSNALTGALLDHFVATSNRVDKW